MQIHTYKNASDYLKRVQPVWQARESLNSLILGITLRAAEHPEWLEQPPYFAWVEGDQDEIRLTASMTPPHLMLLSTPDLPVSELKTAYTLLIDNLMSGNWAIMGVIAENELARQFAEYWTQATGQSYRMVLRERLYELRQVTPPPNPPGGFFRLARPSDLETVIRWHYAFMDELMEEGDLEISRKTAARRIEHQNVFLWDDGGPVSMAFSARPTPQGASVTTVYTPPAMRGHGYASACVAALSQHILDSGKAFCNLFTDLDNPTSNAIYQKIGYQPIGDFLELDFF